MGGQIKRSWRSRRGGVVKVENEYIKQWIDDRIKYYGKQLSKLDFDIEMEK